MGQTVTPIPIGAGIPQITIEDLNGAQHPLSEFLDTETPTIFVFTSATCEPCHALLPELARLSGSPPGRRHVDRLAVAQCRGDARVHAESFR